MNTAAVSGYGVVLEEVQAIVRPLRADDPASRVKELAKRLDLSPGTLVSGRGYRRRGLRSRLVSYPVGFEVTLDAFTRSPHWGDAFEAMGEWGRSEDDRPPSELLLYGVEFADGRKASNLGGMFGGSVVAVAATEEPELDPDKDISLVPGGGHGGRRHSRQELWIWPLPPPGPVAFVCESASPWHPREQSRA
jgi:hypothetical protein